MVTMLLFKSSHPANGAKIKQSKKCKSEFAMEREGALAL